MDIANSTKTTGFAERERPVDNARFVSGVQGHPLDDRFGDLTLRAGQG
jgi:hypothetical protein